MRKIIKSSHADRTNTFRLHYFPNIPTRGARTAPADAPSATTKTAAEPAAGGQLKPGVGPAGGGSGGAADERDQFENIAKKAYAEGFAQGEQDAKALAEQQIAPLIGTLGNVIAELTDTRQKLQRQIESEVVDLALQVGRKVVGQALQTDPDIVARIVHEALKQVDNPEKIAVRLNPADIKRLQSTPAQAILGGHADRIQFEADAGVEAGGCLVQTEYGEIDARIEKQFRAIEEAFRAETMGIGPED